MKVIAIPECNKFKITIHFEWLATPEQIFGKDPGGTLVQDIAKKYRNMEPYQTLLVNLV